MENITDWYYLHFSTNLFWHYKNYHLTWQAEFTNMSKQIINIYVLNHVIKCMNKILYQIKYEFSWEGASSPP